jgi:hypothetical protein
MGRNPPVVTKMGIYKYPDTFQGCGASGALADGPPWKKKKKQKIQIHFINKYLYTIYQ